MDLEESFANLSVASDIGVSPRRKNPIIQKFYNLSPHYTDEGRDPHVAVILAPDSYKHEFQRSWETKAFLKTVVERPERLNACALGIGAAETKVPLQLVECSGGRDLRQSKAVLAVHGQDWVDKLYDLCKDVASKHAENKVEVPETWPAGDMYLATESVRALESVTSAIEQALDLMFSGGPISRTFCCVRPPGHHCHQGAASGFCLMNNAHVAIQHAKEFGVTHAVIFDFDLHHGDGTQDVCWKLGLEASLDKKEIPVGYFSIHDIHSFPTERGFADASNIMAASTCVEGHDMHIWNVHLEQWKTMADFNELYDQKYSQLFKQAVKFFQTHRDLGGRGLVVISAGFDGSEHEMKSMQRHQVSVPTSFFNRFTRDCCALAETFCEGRVLSLLEGGYSNAALATGVFSHLTGLGSVPWKDEWLSDKDVEQFDKGARKAWKQQAQWPGDGIRMGRELFALRPVSAPILRSPVARPRRKRQNLTLLD